MLSLRSQHVPRPNSESGIFLRTVMMARNSVFGHKLLTVSNKGTLLIDLPVNVGEELRVVNILA